MLLSSLTGPLADISELTSADSFLQSNFWGAFKAGFGWKALFFSAEWSYFSGDAIVKETKRLLVLQKQLARFFSLAYIPWGPELPASFPASLRTAALAELAAKLKLVLPRNTIFIRFDPPWAEAHLPEDASRPFFRAGADIQAPDTVLVNLEAAPEELLAAMKPKTRYNVRLAEKKTTVTQSDVSGLDCFYTIFRETALRDGIALHDLDYYRQLMETAAPASVHLYLASHETDCIAGIIVLYFDKTATYLYGASSNIKRNVMAPYILQWRAMLDAKAAGCTVYDLFGIPPDASPDHPMAGLFRFKTGFGGRIVHRPGSWDFPCKPFVYQLFRLAERARKLLRDAKKHRGSKG